MNIGLLKEYIRLHVDLGERSVDDLDFSTEIETKDMIYINYKEGSEKQKALKLHNRFEVLFIPNNSKLKNFIRKQKLNKIIQ